VALDVYIAGDGRYELPGAEVTFAMRTSSSDAGFLTRNVVVLDPDGSIDDDPVAMRVGGDPEYQPVHVEQEYVRVPVRDCSSDTRVGCCRDCNAPGIRGDIGVLGLVVLGLMLRKRRR
jgi:hypothetical protein